MTIEFFIFPILLLSYVCLVNPTMSEGVSMYSNPTYNFSLRYPSDWKIQFIDPNNTKSTIQDAVSLDRDSNMLKIASIPSQNVSLSQYVLFIINKNINYYAVNLFSSFSLQNFTDSITVDDNPKYCLDYFVIFSNDERQTPNSILNCYILNNINDNILEFHFVQTGYGIDPINRLTINNIIKSIEFR